MVGSVVAALVANGREGVIVEWKKGKADVEVSGLWRCIRVRRGNSTLMPTHTVFRFKHRTPEMDEVIAQRDPVATWPNELLGTYYDVLGVGSQAEGKVIKDVYNKLSVVLHPDSTLPL